MMLHVFWLLLAGAGRAGAVVQDANCTRFEWVSSRLISFQSWLKAD